jgi:hypothetical protein
LSVAAGHAIDEADHLELASVAWDCGHLEENVVPIRDLIEEILKQPEPIWQLLGVARGLIWHGYDPAALEEGFMRLRDEFTDAGHERGWDILDDVLSFFAGYCLPELAL